MPLVISASAHQVHLDAKEIAEQAVPTEREERVRDDI
jgi:hypothetical protein